MRIFATMLRGFVLTFVFILKEYIIWKKTLSILKIWSVVQSPNQKIPDRKTKCVIKTHINIKQNVIFGAKLKPV